MSIEIAVDPTLCHARPINRKPPVKHVKELALSMTTHGQITPAIVRKHPTKDGQYEIAAGVCRRDACVLNGTHLKIIVREMTDEEIDDAVLIENLQREDLDPYDEAERMADVINAGQSVVEFAARAGKSSKWMKSRVRLSNLHPEAKKVVRDSWPLDAVEALADLDKDAQLVFLEEFRWHEPKSAKEVQETIRRAAIKVDGLEFLKDPATAHGDCSDGCKSSSEDMLFKVEGKCAVCTNKTCFTSRLMKHAEMLIAAHVSAGETVLISNILENVMNNKLGKAPELKTYNAHHPISEFGRKVVKPGRNTRTLIGINAARTGIEIRYAVIPDNKKDTKGGKQIDAADGSKIQDGKPSAVDMLKAKRFIALLEAVRAALAAYDFLPTFPLIAAFGTHDRFSREIFAHGNRWEMLRKSVFTKNIMLSDKKKPKDAMSFLREEIREQLQSRLAFAGGNMDALRNKELGNEVLAIAKWMGFDLEAERIRIANELPPSKSWANTIDPLTLNPK